MVMEASPDQGELKGQRSKRVDQSDWVVIAC